MWVGDARSLGARQDLLTQDEVARARRRAGPDGRTDARAAAVLLKLAVSRLTGVPAHDLVVLRSCARCGGTDHGRPRVRGPGAAAPGGRPWPDVSVAHSRGIVAVAVVTSGRVGIDLECGTPLPGVARLVCSDSELALVEQVAPQERRAALLRLWTRKEAVLKVTGTGLAGPWRAIDVRSSEARPPDGVRPGPLHLYDLPGVAALVRRSRTLGQHCPVAALATTAPLRRVRLHGEGDLLRRAPDPFRAWDVRRCRHERPAPNVAGGAAPRALRR